MTPAQTTQGIYVLTGDHIREKAIRFQAVIFVWIKEPLIYGLPLYARAE
jgi:hypothetical protein